MKKKIFVVATNGTITAIVKAQTKEKAIKIANKVYKERFDEDRDDWVAYDALEYFGDDLDALMLQTAQ